MLANEKRKEVQRNEKQIFETVNRTPFDGDYAI